MRAYLSVFKMRLRMELQYRGAMIGGILCQMFFGLVLVALYKTLYDGNPQPMPFSSIATYVWLQQAFFRMMLGSDSDLLDKIRSGDISYDMCRPVNMYGFYYARIMAQKFMGSIMRAVPMLILAAILPMGYGISGPASVWGLLSAIPALFLGLLCVCALENITMAFTMKTLDPRGMQGLLNLLMMTLSGNILPLTLFPDSWQKVITFFPYAQLLDAPIRLYTGDYLPVDALRVYALQGFWVIVLVSLGVAMWNANKKRMVVQGG
ncbi:ABC transporter permease [Butyrivibrio sp. VCB2006]|uniref:ABC transporter permease n=1 Tax=Butyrivibrio sp. VCB2006 TaxID=1280679 RepID=UPI00041A6C76|nr:ABC-2 family transporter protein [Butyrivibrio sp. VCB2006]